MIGVSRCIKSLVICIFNLLFVCLPVCANENRFATVAATDFKQFSSFEGLPNNMVHQVYQDRDGYIWIATYYGLFRYDGYEVRGYKSNLYTPGLLVNNNVLCLREDYSGRLWIGTHEGLCVLDKRTGKIRSVHVGGMEKQRVNDIWVTRDGRVYLGYIRGLAVYDAVRDTLVVMNSQNSKGDVPERINIQALYEDEGGNILIGTWKHGLYRYNVKENHFHHYSPLNEENSVLTLFRDSYKNYWVGSNGFGLYKVRFSADRQDMHVWNYRNHPGISSSLPSDFIYSISEDLQNHSLWVGTRNGIGIMPLADEGSFTVYQKVGERYCALHEVTSVSCDRNGLMWVGTKGAGVFHLDSRMRPFRPLNEKVFSDFVPTLYVEENGALWVGMNYGVAYVHEEKGCEHIVAPSKRPYHISYSQQTGYVLLAFHDGGILACRNGKVIREYTTSNCGFIPHDLVYSIYEDRRGNWWVCSYKGLGVRYKDGREFCLFRMRDSDSILSKEMTSMIEGEDGTLWIATESDGIIRIEGNKECPDSLTYSVYDMRNGRLPVNTPLCFFSDRNGRIWVGTEGSGLCLYDSEKDAFISVHREYGLPGDMVNCIEEDGRGNLWLGTNQGLVKLPVADKIKGDRRIFTIDDGLPDNFFSRNASCYRNGMFYFGCSRGVVAFRPEWVEERNKDVSVVVTDILVDGKSLENMSEEQRSRFSNQSSGFTSALTLPASYTGFTVRLASLTYSRPYLNKYAYRLLGYEDEVWNYTDAYNRNVSYSNLPAGEYILELKGTNENGYWSRIRQMNIIIEPPLWNTWYAYLFYVLLFVAVCILLRWKIRRQLQRRNQKLLVEGNTDKMHYLKLQLFADICSDDEHFLQEAVACVNRHLDDSGFDVTCFADEMAVSRTTLHTKLKSLTGLSAIGFIRSIRLKAACKIMDENKNIRISELAYMVGFNDPKYFSVCFKKEFGLHPTEYQKKVTSER